MSDFYNGKGTMDGETKGWTLFGMTALVTLGIIAVTISQCTTQQNQILAQMQTECVAAGGSFVPGDGSNGNANSLCLISGTFIPEQP